MVAGAYADARRVPHAPLAPELLPRVARAAGVDVCLLDTAVKDGRGLLDWLSPDALTALVDEAHELGLEVALAGALRAEDLPVVRATGADIAGVRSAACAAAAHRLARPARVRPARCVRVGVPQAAGPTGVSEGRNWPPEAGPQCNYAARVSVNPETCSRCAHVRALRSRMAAGTASPQAAAAAAPRATRSSMRS